MIDVDLEKRRCEAALGGEIYPTIEKVRKGKSGTIDFTLYRDDGSKTSITHFTPGDIYPDGDVHISHYSDDGEQEYWMVSEGFSVFEIEEYKHLPLLVELIYKLGLPPTGLAEHGLIPSQHQIMEWGLEMRKKGF